MPEQGFTKYAEAVITDAKARSPQEVTADEEKFLTEEFDPARERMTSLASTVGTAGSFLLVLVALLVSFASGFNEQSDELVAASEKARLLAEGCSEEAASETCDTRRLEQQLAAVEREQRQLKDLGDLNVAQTVAGGAVLLGFLLGLAAHLTNPIPGPKPAGQNTRSVDAWDTAVDRLKVKRNWIIGSFLVQVIIGVGAIGWLAWEVFF
jgi:hypothetical protein